MQIFRSEDSLKDFLENAVGRVGFVPTMGALHAGHLQLVNEAKKSCDLVIVSVYVNPTQFNNAVDLENYPRDEEGDAEKLRGAGCDVVWFPKESEMYPDGLTSNQYDLGTLEDVMEGTFRPGHYQGVATIVDRLFRVVKPDVAVFGEKDFQQVAVIRKMVELKGHTVQIVTAPTVREQSGLAMSSRNELLTSEHRREAAVIYRSMEWVKQEGRAMEPSEAVRVVRDEITQRGLEVEYVEIADSNTLVSLENWNDSQVPRIFVAAYAGKVRLIDNLYLN